MKQTDLYALLRDMRAGNPAAFPAVYDMLAKPLYIIAYRITQSKEQAEDLTQELFLKLYLSPPDETVKNPRAWIFRMMHNLAIDMTRSRQPEELPEALPGAGCISRADAGPNANALPDTFVSAGPGPHRGRGFFRRPLPG